MSRGGRTLRSLVTAAVAVAVPCAAAGAKLDKSACADLANEMAVITETGVKGDMERGPEWAMANLPVERLQSIRRLLEIEDQIEFRCGGRNAVARQMDKDKKAKDRAPPAQAPGQQHAIEQRPAPGAPTAAGPAPTTEKRASPPALVVVKPPVAVPSTAAAPAAASPGSNAPPPAVAPVTGNPPLVPAATKAPPPAPPVATATPAVGSVPPPAPVVGAAPPVTAPTAALPAPVTKLGPLPSAAGASAAPAATPPAPNATPAAKKPGDPAPTQAARKKSPRRNPSSAYVSPSEVTPFSLPGMR